jgi:predicted transcriptional regulator
MNNEERDIVSDALLLRMTTDIVSSFLSKNAADSKDLPQIITNTFSALKATLQVADIQASSNSKPAIAIRRSITPDFLVCLEDGRKLKMLKRHLRTSYDMTPEEYRYKWNLPSDYPMVAPNYAKRRSDFAKKTGFGKKSSKR